MHISSTNPLADRINNPDRQNCSQTKISSCLGSGTPLPPPPRVLCFSKTMSDNTTHNKIGKQALLPALDKQSNPWELSEKGLDFPTNIFEEDPSHLKTIETTSRSETDFIESDYQNIEIFSHLLQHDENLWSNVKNNGSL